MTQPNRPDLPPLGPAFSSNPLTRRRLLVGAGSLAALTLLGCSTSDSGSQAVRKPVKASIDGDLNLFNFEEYIPDEVLTGFEQEYGVKIKPTYFSTEEEMMKKLASNLPFDIVFMASNVLSQAIDENLLMPVDHDSMENWDSQVLPGFKQNGFEPDDEKKNERNLRFIGAPYAMGGAGLAWLKDKLGTDQLSGSFQDLWDYAAGDAKNHAYAWDEPRSSLAIALALNGYSINSTSQSELDTAVDSLLELKPNLAGFGGVTTNQYLLTGRGWILMAYAGDTYNSIAEASNPQNILWEACRESAILNNDCMVIPSAAKHPGTATVFMDYVLRPDNMKKVVEYIGYEIPTKAGRATFMNLTADYPFLRGHEKAIEDPSQWLSSLTADQLRMWNQAWTKVKTG